MLIILIYFVFCTFIRTFANKINQNHTIMIKNIRILAVSAAMLLGATTAQAQFGNIVSGIKKAKETVDDVNKKRNGDIEFSRGGTVQGFFPWGSIGIPHCNGWSIPGTS